MSAYLAWRASFEPQKSESQLFENVTLEIKVPKQDTVKLSALDLGKAPVASEQMFSSLHGLLQLGSKQQEHISFEIVASDGEIIFYTAVPKHLQGFIEGQVYAQYPDAQIRVVADYLPQVIIAGENATHGFYLNLSKPYFFPIKTFVDFEVDPLAAITGALTQVGAGSVAAIQILVRPIPDNWQKPGYDYVEKVRTGAKPVSLSLGELLKSAQTEVF